MMTLKQAELIVTCARNCYKGISPSCTGECPSFPLCKESVGKELDLIYNAMTLQKAYSNKHIQRIK